MSADSSQKRETLNRLVYPNTESLSRPARS